MEIKNKTYIVGLLLIGFIVRFLAFQSGYIFTSDVRLFQHWGQMAHLHGLSQVYSGVIHFIDYPPLYLYVLYVLGALSARFGWDQLDTIFNFVTFIPAMLADLGIGYIIYRMVAYGRLTKLKKEDKQNDLPIGITIKAIVISALWVLNPAIILISAVWGQVESVFVIFLLLSLLLLREKKLVASYVLFGIALLIKAQSLFLGPVYLYSAFAHLHDNLIPLKNRASGIRMRPLRRLCEKIANADTPVLRAIVPAKGYRISPKAWSELFIAIGAAGILMFILVLPFVEGVNIMPIIRLYTGVMDTYPWTSVNAFNFWALMGRNWVALEQTFLGISHSTWGVITTITIIIAAIAALHRDRVKFEGRHFFFIVAALFSIIFVFSVRMHERYLFPALLFFLMYYIETHERRGLGLYAAFSFAFFVNCIEILRWSRDIAVNGWNIDVIATSTSLISAVNVGLGILIIVFCIRTEWMGKRVSVASTTIKEASMSKSKSKPKKVKPAPPLLPPKANDPPLMMRRDWAFLFILIGVYSFIAFFRLGDFRAPVTSWAPVQHEQAIIDFGQTQAVAQMQYRMGPSRVHWNGTHFDLEYSNDGMHWNLLRQMNPSFHSSFNWQETNLHFEGQFLRITIHTQETRIQELAFRDAYRELIPIYSVSPGAEALVDEQHLVPDRRTFMNSSYFDEVYHPRAGYEFLHGLRVFETTHPNMGQNFKALSMAIFGPTPFGWRLPGTLAGVLMVPLLYAFARLLFKSNNWGLFAATLFTFDFMHFAQTRLATIDSYVVLFIIAMYFFMYRFIHGIERDDLKKKLWILALCGISTGFAIATKWQGIYALIGLPIVFFPALYRLYLKDRKQATTIFYSCFGFFIAIPLLIYIVSFIPFVNAGVSIGNVGGLRAIWDNNVSMWDYHSYGVLGAEHPFSSAWWEWPLNLRPLLLYANHTADGLRSSMATFGNPVLWWTGIAAMVYFIWYFFTNLTPGEFVEYMRKPAFTRRRLVTFKGFDRDVGFLLVAFAAQYLPWVGITRLTWVYHYFPSVPFLTLIVAWVFKQAIDRRPKWKPWAIGFACVCVALFALFYPVLSAVPMNPEFVQRYLQWLPRWQF